ncbi:NUDIX hydrolase [Gordonia sp. CPCC 205333]|uniref:NUDIX hydrolase n=1 Tax=Gordonia sp. CPCC 205333 TaxID=3140790 RepID=UPI003AF38269
MPVPTVVEVLSAVFQIGPADEYTDTATLRVLLRRDDDRWTLPGGGSDANEKLSDTARHLLVAQTDERSVRHLEQLSVFSDPDRVSGARTIASTYLGLVPSDAPPATPSAAAWYDVNALPPLAFDHANIVEAARHRLAAKLSYTNIAFALAPAQFPMSELSEIYGAALGYPVDTTNLLRILSRRGVIAATGTVRRNGRGGGRPPALYRFVDTELRVTDEFATLRPPL